MNNIRAFPAGRSGPGYSLIRLQALAAGRYPFLSLTRGAVILSDRRSMCVKDSLVLA